MPRLRPWPSIWPIGKRPIANRYVLKSGETFKKGDAVVKDGTPEVQEVSGANPTPILGFAAEDAESVGEPGFVMVYTAADQGVLFAMNGDDDPVVGDVDIDYGILEDSDGVYHVNGAETSSTRLTVKKVDLPRKLYYCVVRTANVQSV